MPSRYPLRNLTPRVMEIAAMVVDGDPVPEVAAQLGITPQTVKSALVLVRRHLRAEGYVSTNTTIRLRKALRARGDIDHLESI